MKKKIISLLLISICGLLVGCDCHNKDKVNRDTKDNTCENRFVLIGDEYYIGECDKYSVVYDKKQIQFIYVNVDMETEEVCL